MVGSKDKPRQPRTRTRIQHSIVRRPWTREEDEKLVQLVEHYGDKDWAKIAKELHQYGRSNKSCRFRWHNHLAPSVIKASFSAWEDAVIVRGHEVYGNKWAAIARNLPGRTESSVKNRWNALLRKTRGDKLLRNMWLDQALSLWQLLGKPSPGYKDSVDEDGDYDSSEHDGDSGFSAWEDAVIVRGHEVYGNKWADIARHLPGYSESSIKDRWNALQEVPVYRNLWLDQELSLWQLLGEPSPDEDPTQQTRPPNPLQCVEELNGSEEGDEDGDYNASEPGVGSGQSSVTKARFSAWEDAVIVRGHEVYGNKWAAIANYLPGRTESSVRNRWNALLRKTRGDKLLKNTWLDQALSLWQLLGKPSPSREDPSQQTRPPNPLQRVEELTESEEGDEYGDSDSSEPDRASGHGSDRSRTSNGASNPSTSKGLSLAKSDTSTRYPGDGGDKGAVAMAALTMKEQEYPGEGTPEAPFLPIRPAGDGDVSAEACAPTVTEEVTPETCLDPAAGPVKDPNSSPYFDMDFSGPSLARPKSDISMKLEDIDMLSSGILMMSFNASGGQEVGESGRASIRELLRALAPSSNAQPYLMMPRNPNNKMASRSRSYEVQDLDVSPCTKQHWASEPQIRHRRSLDRSGPLETPFATVVGPMFSPARPRPGSHRKRHASRSISEANGKLHEPKMLIPEDDGVHMHLRQMQQPMQLSESTGGGEITSPEANSQSTYGTPSPRPPPGYNLPVQESPPTPDYAGGGSATYVVMTTAMMPQIPGLPMAPCGEGAPAQQGNIWPWLGANAGTVSDVSRARAPRAAGDVYHTLSTIKPIYEEGAAVAMPGPMMPQRFEFIGPRYPGSHTAESTPRNACGIPLYPYLPQPPLHAGTSAAILNSQGLGLREDSQLPWKEGPLPNMVADMSMKLCLPGMVAGPSVRTVQGPGVIPERTYMSNTLGPLAESSLAMDLFPSMGASIGGSIPLDPLFSGQLPEGFRADDLPLPLERYCVCCGAVLPEESHTRVCPGKCVNTPSEGFHGENSTDSWLRSLQLPDEVDEQLQ